MADGIILTEKFIGFIDILGYSSLTKVAEEGRGLTLDDLDAIQALLGSEKDRETHRTHGPTTCPTAPYIRKDIDFELTQFSDSLLVSSEISPAGVINLASHCFGACIMLLTKGIMCRGYVKRGMIYHRGNRMLGSGLVDAVAEEKNVSFFKRDADERGTPFIEVDPAVVEYINIQPDKCVKEMFSRMVVTHDGLTAIFPIKRLSHKFIIGGIGFPSLDGKKEKARNDVVRNNIKRLKEKVLSFVENADASVVKKSEHYIRALDEQLKVCDRTDEMIDALQKPSGTRGTRENLPGRFR